MKKQAQNSFRFLFFAFVAVVAFSCKKSDSSSPAPANTVKLGTTSQVVSHVYYDGNSSGKRHYLYVTSGGVSFADDDFKGTGKLFYLAFSSADSSATLPVGTYTATVAAVAAAEPDETRPAATAVATGRTAAAGDLYVDIYDVLDGDTDYFDGDDNSIGLQNKQLVITKSGDIYTISFKSKSGISNTAYEIYFNGKLDRAALRR